MKSIEAERNMKKSNLGFIKDKRYSPSHMQSTHLDRMKKFNFRRGGQISPLRASKLQLPNLPVVPDLNPTVVPIGN